MWLGLIMAFNVWFIIWPNQKKALGIVDCSPEDKPKHMKTALSIKNKYFISYQCCFQWLWLKTYIKFNYYPFLIVF